MDGLIDRQVVGLDMPSAEHIALFDFARDGTEYIRGVGCAARGDRAAGRVTLLTHGRQLGFARALLALDEAGKAVNVER